MEFKKGMSPIRLSQILTSVLLLLPVAMLMGMSSRPSAITIGSVFNMERGRMDALASQVFIRGRSAHESNECEVRPAFMARNGGSVFVVAQNPTMDLLQWRGGKTSSENTDCGTEHPFWVFREETRILTRFMERIDLSRS